MKDKTQLFKDLKYHNRRAVEVDKELAKICFEEVKPLLDSKQYIEAKHYISRFFKDADDLSFERDIMLANINRIMRNEGLL